VTTVRAVLTDRFVDDAGLFPPQELDMVAAVARDRRDRSAASPVLTHTKEEDNQP
jgi:hypothetical protein